MSLGAVTIVGASLAGLRAAQTLRREGFDGEMTLIGEEGHGPYNRPALSKSYLKHVTADVGTLPLAEAADCTVLAGTRAVGLDLPARQLLLTSKDGRPWRHSFDGLVIATGAAPRPLPWPTPPGVHSLRSAHDADVLRAQLLVGRPRVVVVGAGLIGGEVAATCRALGLDVALVGQERPLEATLGAPIGTALEEIHRDHGVDVRPGVSVTGFTGSDRVSGVRLSTGAVLPADVVVVGIGAAPATTWLEGSGLPLRDGIRCTSSLAVHGTERIVAAGDVARWTDPRTGRSHRDEHWENAHRQGEAAARTLLSGDGAAPYDVTTMFWTEQHDCRLQAVGRPHPSHEIQLLEGDPRSRSFVALYRSDGVAEAAVLVNMPHRLRHYRQLIADARSDQPHHPSNPHHLTTT